MNGRGVAPLPKTPAPKPAMEPPKCNCGGSCDRCASSALQRSGRGVPQRGGIDAVQNVLRTPGAPLHANVRTPMERAFNHDFSRVRVHHDSAAGDSARLVGARAYTVGDHIAFGAGAYEPSTEAGRRLLAHELAHTIQQRDSGAELAPSLEIGSADSPAEGEADRVADAVIAGKPAGTIGRGAAVVARQRHSGHSHAAQPSPPPPPPPEMCRRRHHVRVAGFDGTAQGAHISHIDVLIRAHGRARIQLTWAHLLPNTPVPPGTLSGSTGAGLCQMQFPGEAAARPVDCSNPSDANTRDTLCTPLDDFRIQGHQCALHDDSRATRVSWFLIQRVVAFHNYPTVPRFPGSHGCVRVAPARGVGGADWIHDNTIANVTTVHVHRAPNAPGPSCWSGPRHHDPLVERPEPAAPPPAGGAPAHHRRRHH